ncbi:MAG: putative LPLAT superfamily acyltransferase [Planctomycetota bacterium]|jgi:predicted LPLAT superfamily acyltransferase
MAKKWDGKSKGNIAGYQFFVSIINIFGLGTTYFFLKFVTFYYYLFSPTKKYLLDFYQNGLAKTLNQSKKLARENYYIFGQTLVDRFAFLMEKGKQYDHKSTGGEHLKQLVENGKGGILLSGHLGNWELAGNFLKVNYNAKVNVLMYQAEAEKLADFFESVTGGVDFNIIPIKDDFSHIIKIHMALGRNEFICLHADRNMPGAKTIALDFLGRKAHFPLGPFQLCSKFDAPVCYVFNVKTDKYFYSLSSSAPITEKLSAEEFAKKYIATFEEKCKDHPEQWFNFYDFWAK